MYTPANITRPEDIHAELETIQAFLVASYSADLPAEVQSRFDSLGGYMARSGKLKADAEYHYQTMVYSTIMQTLKDAMDMRLSASTVNKLIEAEARNLKFLMTWADRVNRSCTHQLEAMRSVFATLRAERFANNYGR